MQRLRQNIISGSKTSGWIDPQFSNGIAIRKQEKRNNNTFLFFMGILSLTIFLIFLMKNVQEYSHFFCKGMRPGGISP